MYSMDTFQFRQRRCGFPHSTGASTATESGRPLTIKQLVKTLRFYLGRSMETGQVEENGTYFFKKLENQRISKQERISETPSLNPHFRYKENEVQSQE